MYVDFTLHWLLPFEHVNTTHKVPYVSFSVMRASNSYVCFNHGTFSMHCRTTLCYIYILRDQIYDHSLYILYNIFYGLKYG